MKRGKGKKAMKVTKVRRKSSYLMRVMRLKNRSVGRILSWGRGR